MRTALVIFILCSLCAVSSAQNKRLLKPFATTIVIKNQKSVDLFVNNNYSNKHLKEKVLNNTDETNTFDTLSYRKMIGGNWNVNFGVFGQEYLVMWFQAPTDLIIKAVGAAFAENLNNAEGSLKLYEVVNNISIEDLSNIGPIEVKQGRFKSEDSTYALGYVGFEEFSDGSGYENVGNLESFPFTENAFWSEGMSYPILPEASSFNQPAYQFFETKLVGFEPWVARGELFAIVFKNESVNSLSDRIGIWANRTSSNPDYYGWKFNTYGKSANDTSTAYWYSLEYTLDFAAVVEFISSDWKEDIVLSPDSIFLSNYSEIDSCNIINNSNQTVYLDSIYNKSFSSYSCHFKKDSEYYSFLIDPYEKSDSLHIQLNPMDTAMFMIVGIDVCPICKKQYDEYLRDTLVFAFSSDSNQTTEKLLLLNSNISLDVDEENINVKSFYLSQNFPNPFNPSTKIKFVIPKSSFVNLKIYDVLGREVATLVNEEKPAGSYEVEFDASQLSSGIYFYQLRTDNYSSVKKMILLK